MPQYLMVLATLSIGLLASPSRAEQPPKSDEPNTITAIDVLLEPDATMTRKAEDANERLLKVFPEGFALARRINRTSRVCSGS